MKNTKQEMYQEIQARIKRIQQREPLDRATSIRLTTKIEGTAKKRWAANKETYLKAVSKSPTRIAAVKKVLKNRKTHPRFKALSLEQKDLYKRALQEGKYGEWAPIAKKYGLLARKLRMYAKGLNLDDLK